MWQNKAENYVARRWAKHRLKSVEIKWVITDNPTKFAGIYIFYTM